MPQGQEKVAAVQQMFDAIAPRYDLVNRIMTFRLDVRWRKIAVRSLQLPTGSTVLDLASGTGDLCIDLASAGYRPLSADLSFGMLAADRSGAPRIQADILNLPVPDGSVVKKGMKIFSRFSRGIPGPLSSIVTRTIERRSLASKASSETKTRFSPRFAVISQRFSALKAFWIKLSSTW